ncbi:HepT-like ribonuclease domain-containing protein [Hymenobacter antarcticus]|uniref:DUF86 domain-containing protein n=1 Tax=Hymenobacter antarcticus TaxID=486270 RepID=A0ABP7QXV3_9BACT
MSKQLDSTRLQHLQYAAERLLKRLSNSTLVEFLSDEDLQDIALRQFTVMGEAAAHVSDALKRQHPQIDWRRAAGFRNFVVHEYFRVDFTLVWDTVVSVLPPLVVELPPLLQQVIADEKAKAQGNV